MPDAEPPRWVVQKQSTNSSFQGETVLLYVKLQDDVALGTAILSTNETGAWINWTNRYMSPMTLSRNGKKVNETWAVFPWRNSESPIGTTVGWLVWFNDTSGKWNSTSVQAFAVQDFKIQVDEKTHNSTFQVCQNITDFPECDFTLISEALASPQLTDGNDTVEVLRGTYFEPSGIDIRRFNITIHAVNGTDNTTVDAGGAPFAFKFTRIPAQADRVLGKVVNFTIRNADFGVFVDGHDNVAEGLNLSDLTGPKRAAQVTFANNNMLVGLDIDLDGAEKGITIDPSNNTTVRGTRVRNIGESGIDLFDSPFTIIEQSDFEDGRAGISLNGEAPGLIIRANRFSVNIAMESDGNFEQARIENNTFQGGAGTDLSGLTSSNVSRNVGRNLLNGIFLFNDFGTVLSENVVRDSNVCLGVDESDKTKILNNTMQNCSSGLDVGKVEGLRIENNTVQNASFVCLQVAKAESVVIAQNRLSDCQRGLVLFSVNTLSAFHNNFIANVRPVEGVSQDPLELSFNGEGNFWNRTTEPCFVPGVDSDNPNLKDSHPYCRESGWDLVKESVFATVGPAGANVSLPSSNASAVFLPSAFPSDTTMAIRGFDPASATGFVVRNLTDNASLVYQFTASQNITGNVTVTLKFDPAVVAGNFGAFDIFRFNATTGEWESLGAVVDTVNNTYSVNVTKFSFLLVARRPLLFIPATIDSDPDSLNLKSQGRFVTVYIEVPGFDVHKIDLTSIRLNDLLPIEPFFGFKAPPQFGDHDLDEVPDLMVKFDRQEVQAILSLGENVTVTVSGLLDGRPFRGTDTIRVFNNDSEERAFREKQEKAKGPPTHAQGRGGGGGGGGVGPPVVPPGQSGTPPGQGGTPPGQGDGGGHGSGGNGGGQGGGQSQGQGGGGKG